MTSAQPAVGLLLAGCAAQAGPRGYVGPPPEPSEPTYVNPPNQPRLPGSSTAVKVGRVVYLSAQVSVDSAGGVVAPGDLAAQIRQALSNVSALVRAAQGVPGDVVKLTLYVVNYRPDQYPILQQAIERFCM